MKNFINFLPPWVETNIQPAFYDKESGTCLQQTARMYAKVNQLVRSVNGQNETIADFIAQFLGLKDYVDEYFENLDVQEEINNKLDSMVSDGTLDEIIQPYLTQELQSMNERITLIDNKVDASVSGAPLVAESVADMTDTSRIYVNTTNGYWYYYDGEAWSQGGVYQASEDSQTLTEYTNTTKGFIVQLDEAQYIPVTKTQFGYIQNATGAITSDGSRLTTEYVGNELTLVKCDEDYSICVYVYAEDDTYLGRIISDYSISNASSGVTSLWFNTLNMNFIRGLYPEYKFKLVLRKDDYSSINNQPVTFLYHFPAMYYTTLDKYNTLINDKTTFEDGYLFGIGQLDNQTGEYSSINSRLYTLDYLSDDIEEINTTNTYIFKLYAYDKETDAYIGRYSSESGTFTNSGSSVAGVEISSINLHELKKQYPDYKFKIVTYISGNTNAKTQINAKNCHFVTWNPATTLDETVRATFTSVHPATYQLVSKPNYPTHDATIVGNYVYSFSASTQDYAGKFNVYNKNDLTLYANRWATFAYENKDTTTSYLAMKSVDYNLGNNCLAVGNGAQNYKDTDSYIFLFYEADTWKDKTSVITFDNCGAYTKIDVSELGHKSYGYWKDPINATDQMYISINLFEDLYLIQLGKGDNDLGMGVYSEATSDKFNGSFKVLKHWKQKYYATFGSADHGGQAYKNNLYICNNETDKAQIYKVILNSDDTFQFETIDFSTPTQSGGLGYTMPDGMFIQNDTIYTAPIYNNQSEVQNNNRVILKIGI